MYAPSQLYITFVGDKTILSTTTDKSRSTEATSSPQSREDTLRLEQLQNEIMEKSTEFKEIHYFNRRLLYAENSVLYYELKDEDAKMLYYRNFLKNHLLEHIHFYTDDDMADASTFVEKYLHICKRFPAEPDPLMIHVLLRNTTVESDVLSLLNQKNLPESSDFDHDYNERFVDSNAALLSLEQSLTIEQCKTPSWEKEKKTFVDHLLETVTFLRDAIARRYFATLLLHAYKDSCEMSEKSLFYITAKQVCRNVWLDVEDVPILTTSVNLDIEGWVRQVITKLDMMSQQYYQPQADFAACESYERHINRLASLKTVFDQNDAHDGTFYGLLYYFEATYCCVTLK